MRHTRWTDRSRVLQNKVSEEGVVDDVGFVGAAEENPDLNKVLSQKLEAQIQRLELLTTQCMTAGDALARPIDATIMHDRAETVDEGDENKETWTATEDCHIGTSSAALVAMAGVRHSWEPSCRCRDNWPSILFAMEMQEIRVTSISCWTADYCQRICTLVVDAVLREWIYYLMMARLGQKLRHQKINTMCMSYMSNDDISSDNWAWILFQAVHFQAVYAGHELLDVNRSTKLCK